MSRASLFIPLGVFSILVVFLYLGFSFEDKHRLPSALLNQPFPTFSLPKLMVAEQATQEDLHGTITLVNVWGTWCPTCRAEHDKLLEIAATEGLRIVGINYKDDPAKAQQWLTTLGNPYVWTVVDREGRLGIDLGVYGAPESFLVDADGMIRFKWVGDVNDRVWANEFKPRLDELRRLAGVAAPDARQVGMAGG